MDGNGRGDRHAAERSQSTEADALGTTGFDGNGRDRHAVGARSVIDDRGVLTERPNHNAVCPPSMNRHVPVMYDASSDARKAMPFAISRAVPGRFSIVSAPNASM